MLICFFLSTSGSCWAFSAAAIVNAVQLKTDKNATLVSPQQLINCDHKVRIPGIIATFPFLDFIYLREHTVATVEVLLLDCVMPKRTESQVKKKFLIKWRKKNATTKRNNRLQPSRTWRKLSLMVMKIYRSKFNDSTYKYCLTQFSLLTGTSLLALDRFPSLCVLTRISRDSEKVFTASQIVVQKTTMHPSWPVMELTQSSGITGLSRIHGENHGATMDMRTSPAIKETCATLPRKHW